MAEKSLIPNKYSERQFPVYFQGNWAELPKADRTPGLFSFIQTLMFEIIPNIRIVYTLKDRVKIRHTGDTDSLDQC